MVSFGMVRHITSELHAFEAAFFRSFFGLLFMLPWFLRSGAIAFKTSRFGMHVARSVFHAGASLCFIFALTIAPFAELTALYFVAPVFVTVMAVVFLRETVGLQRWTAVTMGFAGMLVILRPGIEDLELGSLLAIVSAMCGASSVILTKGLARTEAVVTISAYTMVLMSLFTMIPAAFVWQWPSLEILPWLVVIGAGGGLAYFLFASAIKTAEISVLAPITFLQLIWAAAIGFLFFDEVPEIFVWIGGFMIFAATSYIAICERVAARSAERAEAAEE